MGQNKNLSFVWEQRAQWIICSIKGNFIEKIYGEAVTEFEEKNPNNRNARALWQVAPGAVALREETLSLDQDTLLLRTKFSGISRGTEGLVLQGKVPPSEYERMRGPNMEGQFPFPVKYGYSNVGRVEWGPSELVGRHVFLLYPHQDIVKTRLEDINLIPESVPPSRAVLAANMETALNIVWDAQIQPGDRVAVFGAGVVGCLTAYLAGGIAGTEVILIDTNGQRQPIADALGVTFSSPHRLSGAFDVLINATASDEALNLAIAHAGKEARIVEASWYGDRRASITLGGAFHANRLQLVSSQVGTIPAHKTARWTYKRRMTKALELLSDPRLDILISGETAFEDLEAAYPRIVNAPDTLCHRIRY